MPTVARAEVRSPGGAAVSSSPLPWPHILIAVVIFVTFGTYRRREIWELWTASGFDSEVKLKLAAWMLLGGVALLLWRPVLRNSHLLLQPPLVFYAGFCLLAILSATYSVAPALSLFRAAQLAVLIALGLAAAGNADRWPTLAMIYLGLNWLFLLIGLLGSPASLHWRVLPSYQEPAYDSELATWRFGTPVGHFSEIGIVAAMAAVALAARLRRGPSLQELALFAWLVLTVLLTVSRTAMVALVLGLLVVLALRGVLALATLAGTALVALLLTLPGVVETVAAFLQRGQTEEDLMTLTNRTSIYESALQLLDGHWLLGYGYRAARAVVLDQQLSGAGVSHAHNAVLEAAVGLGMGGAVLAVLVLLGFLVCSLRLLRMGRGVEFVALFPPVFVNSMLDASFAIEVCPFVVVFVSVLVDLARCRSESVARGRLSDGQGNLGPDRRDNPRFAG